MAVSSRDARYALIIAVDTYQDPELRGLQAPLRDAEKLAGVLRATDVGNFRRVEVLENPDARTAQEQIERFFMTRRPLDVVVLHFSGHAFRGERSDDLFLAMTDTRKAAPYATSVSGDFLRTMIERSPARRKLLLLDCCHSGALTLTRGTQDGGTDEARTAADFSHSVGRIVPQQAEPHASGTGTIIIGAARAAELAHEAGTGALTAAVVEGLRTGDADLQRTGRISTENLFEYVTLWFSAHRPQQHPVLQQRSRSGPFIVAENCRHQPAALPPELEVQLADEDPELRLAGVRKLRERSLSFDHDDASTARRRLEHVARFDIDEDVADAAHRALLRTSLTVQDELLDFGTVRAGEPPGHLITHVAGPPLASGWRVLPVDHPAITATRSDDRLEVVLRADRPGPVHATVHLTSDAGDAAVRVTAAVRRTPVAVLVAGWVRRAVDRPQPTVLTGRRRMLATAVAGSVLITATSFQYLPSARVVGSCVPGSDLRVLTTAGLRDAVAAAAAGFTADSPDDDCPDVRVTVSTVTSDGHAQRRIARQWPDDELRDAGPSPDVWLPESSTQVGLAREAVAPDAPRRLELPEDAATRAASVATSPLVLAVPEKDAPTAVTWKGVLNGPWTIPRADPRNSTTGLLATYALHWEAGPPQNAERVFDRSQGGDDARSDLCRHRLSAVAPPADTAYLVTEKDVADYNTGRPLGDACQVAEGPAANRRLRPVPVAGAPALDVPCVPIEGSAWGDGEQRRLARAFCAHLRGPGGQVLQQYGLDPPAPAGTARIPTPETAERVIGAWGSAQRPVRMLLAMDVSGSMRLPVAGASTPRIAVTKAAAKQAVARAALGAGDEVGLWEFATQLSGDRDYRELVPLAGATSDHQTELAGALDTLEPTRQNTGLHDTISAGIERLRQQSRPDAEFPPVNLLVVLTDGENDDARSVGVPQIGQQLRDSDVQVSVIASVGANCRSFRSLIEQGLGCFDENRGGLAAAFDKALPTRLSGARPAGS